MMCFIFHKWHRWAVIDQGPITRKRSTGDGVIGFWTKQQRKCDRCNLIQTKVDRTD